MAAKYVKQRAHQMHYTQRYFWRYANNKETFLVIAKFYYKKLSVLLTFDRNGRKSE